MEFFESFVAFLDVLGFKRMVEKEEDKIKKYFVLLNEAMVPLKDIPNTSLDLLVHPETIASSSGEKYEFEHMSMSDAIVIRIKSGDKSQFLSRLAHLIDHVSLLQTLFAQEDIWIRGGISFGRLAMNRESNFVAGSGLVQAYELESKHAKFSRIILDNKIIEMLGYTNATFFIDAINKTNTAKKRIVDPNASRISSSFPVHDLPLIVDFLSESLKRRDSEVLEKILINLGRNLRTCPLDAYDKYRWVREYLLCCCRDNTYCPEPGFLASMSNHNIPSLC